MAAYRLTVTDSQDAALSRMVAKRNVVRASENASRASQRLAALPLWTNQSHLDWVCGGMLDGYVKEADAEDEAKLLEAFHDPAMKAAIKAAAKIF